MARPLHAHPNPNPNPNPDPDPYPDPTSFKDLFTHEWATALKARLSEFLATTPQFAASPRLLEMLRAQRQGGMGGAYSATLAGGMGGGQEMVEAQQELANLKQRLVDSELRSVETQQSAAAREAPIAPEP